MQLAQTISAVIIALAMVFIGYTVSTQSNTLVKNQAIAACYQTARIQETDEKTGKSVELPENYWFEQCMGKMGQKGK